MDDSSGQLTFWYLDPVLPLIAFGFFLACDHCLSLGYRFGHHRNNVIVAVKKTRGNQDWIDAIERAKTNVEKAGPGLIEELLRIYKGEQSTLNHNPDLPL